MNNNQIITKKQKFLIQITEQLNQHKITKEKNRYTKKTKKARDSIRF